MVFTPQKYKKSGALTAPDVSGIFLFVAFSVYGWLVAPYT
jgi:hypothetical protein